MPGTFFFHPHCDEIGQIGRGLEGMLIVEDDGAGLRRRPRPRRSATGASTSRRAHSCRSRPMRVPARAGTFGTLRSVNGAARPDFAVPAGGYARIRILDVDPTRVMEIGIEGAEAAIIAVDGFAVGPLPLDSWRMGMAMRLDLAIRLEGCRRPASAGRLFRRRAGDARDVHRPSARPTGAALRPAGARRRTASPSRTCRTPRRSRSPSRRPASPAAVAEPITLPDGRVFDPTDGLCLSSRHLLGDQPHGLARPGAPRACRSRSRPCELGRDLHLRAGQHDAAHATRSTCTASAPRFWTARA